MCSRSVHINHMIPARDEQEQSIGEEADLSDFGIIPSSDVKSESPKKVNDPELDSPLEPQPDTPETTQEIRKSA